jgi:hypothetical protein
MYFVKEINMKQFLFSLLRLSMNKFSRDVYKIASLGCFCLFSLVILSGCNLPNQTPTVPSEDNMASMVASTLQSMTMTMEFINNAQGTPAATGLPVTENSTPDSLAPSLTPASSKGKITGLVCYTEVTSTNMVLYFQNTANNQVVELPVSVSNYQAPYTTQLDPGTYIAYAWTLDYSIGGTYSACGAASGCGDATPISFTVNAGQTIEKIDICDWSHGPFDVPYPPGFQPESKFGIISGGVYGYPFGNLPKLTIVAFNKDTGYWYWIGTAAGQSNFTMNDIPGGTYQVVAYDGSGHAGGTSVNIEVKGGQTVNADINNWSGSFPANPVK